MNQYLLLILLNFSVHLSYAQGWGQIQKIVPDDRFAGQQFGATVAVDGNYAVVGVLASNFADSAYVYENDGNGNWLQLQKLESPDPNQFDHFGTQVAISGDYILVGAWGDNEDPSNSNYIQSAGAAYIFKKQASNLFDFEQKIVASNREVNNHFGYTLALKNNYAIVGALRDAYDVDGNNFLANAGAAFIFERDGSGVWNEVQKIVASDRATDDYFAGDGVSIDGNYVIIGAKFEDEDALGMNTLNAAGSAYIFERDGSGSWNEVQKIVASNRQGSELFGSDVSISGSCLVIGAEQGNVAAGYSGSTYIFERDATGTWNETQEIVASHVASIDKFGKSVAFDGSHILVGAYLKDIGSPGDDGAAFMFEKDGAGAWNLVAEMYYNEASTSDYFGYDVAVSGDYAIVGAYSEDEDEAGMNTLSSAGSIFIFDANEPNILDPISTLNIVEHTFTTNFKVFPNPNQGNFTIDFGKSYNQIDISITNNLGQEILKEKHNDSSKVIINLMINSGVYFVNITTGEGELAVIKILKQ
ncbi:T9SS type A sorting domain-containing protein [Winogradskyella flava]|uniref:T9SS type A sorting domain-containing protein n=1 Tax=Winogradskyella flava TaxID=1884876 RepID=A0A842IRN0_9FLAO|nr:T9SS type A sorting domain-containing protein [Winogradskyella flava]MBC2845531.1 T9SS type A sorting domain-containing protein [Winogradskyella flava]